MTTDAEIMEAYKPTGNLTGVNVPGVTFKKIEIIGCQTAKNTAGATWDPNTAATQVNNVLTGDNGTKVDVVLSNNDGMAVQIAKSKTFIDSKALIAGIDALPDAISQLKTNGSQYVASIRNDGKLQSKVVLQALKNMIDGKTSLLIWTRLMNLIRLLLQRLTGWPMPNLSGMIQSIRLSVYTTLS